MCVAKKSDSVRIFLVETVTKVMLSINKIKIIVIKVYKNIIK